MAAMMPPVSIAGIHPATVVLVLVYMSGVRLASTMRRKPMWRPRMTRETRADLPSPESMRHPRSMPEISLQFLMLGGLVGAAGWLIAETGLQISQ
jgi:cation:H+ antiporter